MLTLEEAFDVVEFACIVQFPKIFGLLRKVFSLRESVSLVRDEVGGYGIKLWDERGEVDVWRIVSLYVQVGSAGSSPYFSMRRWPSGTCCLLLELVRVLAIARWWLVEPRRCPSYQCHPPW